MTREIRGIIFDFDGTLVDATDAILNCVGLVARGCGFAAPPPEDVRRMIGRPLVEIFSAAVPAASPSDVERYVEEYRRLFFTSSASRIRVLPGVARTLAHLSSRFGLGIATSRTSDGAERILETLGLRPHISVIVGVEDVERTKPEPEPVLKALRLLGLPPEEGVMVGDTPDDVRAGRTAGLMAVGVTTGAHGRDALMDAGADHVVDGLWELTTLIAPHPPGARGNAFLIPPDCGTMAS